MGIPELFELGSELGQFRWLGSPFDARAETAVSMVNQKEMGEGGV